jgi:multiple sugar transport system ATP-binding protein
VVVNRPEAGGPYPAPSIDGSTGYCDRTHLYYGSSGTYLPVKELFGMATVRFEEAQRWYPGADKPAVPGISLEIGDAEFMVLVGPSGCGKSTTLRMLAGLEEVNKGKIYIGDREITHTPPKDRDIAMVFQNYALYPHMSVADNMAFALKMAKVPSDERQKRVMDAAKILGLTEYLDRKPKALSGGQRQRVAMGRAIVRNPQVFCMDEPLSNLDAKMRVHTRTDIAKLQSDLGVTTVYVTHDQVEAMTMGDRVAVMKDGYLQQVDTPLALYDKPVNLFVAGFIGSPQMNLIEAKPDNGQAKIGDYLVPVDPAAAQRMKGNITVGVRPEAWRVVGNSEDGLPVKVTVVEDLGADAYVYGTCGVEGTPNNIIIRVSGRDHVKKGETMYVTTDPKHVHVFDTDTGERLSE